MNRKFLKFFIFLTIIAVVLGFFIAYKGDKGPPKKEEGLSTKQLKDIEAAGKNKENLKIIGDNYMNTEQSFDPTKLTIEDLLVGDGAQVQDGDTVTVHYTGTFLDGRKFDSSLDRGRPFTFTVGAGQVISGWEQGLLGMKVGGKRKLVIPPNLAYGVQGIPGTIPGNSTLIFEIELLSVDKK